MNIQELADTKRIQDAFIARFNATEEEKLNPKQFTIKCIKHWVKELTESYENNKAIQEARELINSKKQELVV